MSYLRSTTLAAAVAAAALAAAPAGAVPGDPVEWPDEPPKDIPFEPSERFSKLRFTGPYVNHQPVSDTWYPSWGADDKLYSPFMDGGCQGAQAFGGYGASPAYVGMAQITGTNDAQTQAFRCTIRPVERQPYDGRYSSASLHHNGIWYYGSYTLNNTSPPGMADCKNYCTLGPFVGFDVSRDDGLTWEESPHTPAKPLFGESPANGHRVKLGALHVVDFGKNMEHSPDGKMYLVGHGGGGPKSHNTWVNADNVYLVRVTPSPETVNDESAYEYFAGRDSEGRAVWSHDFADIEPLASWPGGRLGSATITYVKALDTYMMWTSAPTDGVNGRGRYDTLLLESKSITGPWRHVHYLREFGPQAYFVNVPTKFVSPDASRMWLSWSANYGNDADPGLTMRPFGSSYSWALREFALERVGARSDGPPPPAGDTSPPATGQQAPGSPQAPAASATSVAPVPRRCAAPRTVAVRVRGGGRRLRAVRVTVNGRRARVARRSRTGVRVVTAGRRATRLRIVVVGRTRAGRRVRAVRSVPARACARRAAPVR